MVAKIISFLQKRGEIFIVIGVLIIAGIIVYSYVSSGDKNSKDALRYANLLLINDELRVFHAKNNTYPLPEDAVSITASGEILTYQGYFGEKTFQDMSIKPIKDPVSDKLYKYLNYYTYATDESKQKFQIMAFYESDENITYNPISKRYPYLYGDDVGIALDQKSARPIQETKLGVDVLNTFDPYAIYMNNKNVLIGDKLTLKNYLANTEFSQAKSCLDIKQAGWSTNGYYYINPLVGGAYNKFSKTLKVYCDLESDGGGWTRLYYKNGKETCSNDENNYNSVVLEKLLTKDFAVSDNLETLHTEGSWILKGVDLNYKDFSSIKFANVANCKTPSGTAWDMGYNNGNYLKLFGTLSTMGTWNQMYYGCNNLKNTGEKSELRIGGNIGHESEFIHSACNDYSPKENSITSRWDWDNTRVIWVR